MVERQVVMANNRESTHIVTANESFIYCWDEALELLLPTETETGMCSGRGLLWWGLNTLLRFI